MEIVIKNNQKLIKANHRTIEKVLRRALTHLTHKGCHSLLSGKQVLKHLEVSVLFVNDAGMRRLNRLYRGIDRTTDVLSFPLHAFGRRHNGCHSGLSGICLQEDSRRASLAGMANPPCFLGDIVISLPRAKRQAKEYETTFYRELGRLLVHGLLHLLGYDHEKSGYQAAKMRRMEAELTEVICL